jgi:hypothetical protein
MAVGADTMTTFNAAALSPRKLLKTPVFTKSSAHLLLSRNLIKEPYQGIVLMNITTSADFAATDIHTRSTAKFRPDKN